MCPPMSKWRNEWRKYTLNTNWTQRGTTTDTQNIEGNLYLNNIGETGKPTYSMVVSMMAEKAMLPALEQLHVTS